MKAPYQPPTLAAVGTFATDTGGYRYKKRYRKYGGWRRYRRHRKYYD